MRFDLHRLACIKPQIELKIQWIPRTENEKADYISRRIDIDNWQITGVFFLAIDSSWRPHSVDCMANFYNTKIPRLIIFRVLEPRYQWSRFLRAKPQLRKLSCGPSNFSSSQSTPLPEYSESQSDARRTALTLVQFLAPY